jgi:tetratricopeptide (TPR) repeat protein
MKKLFLNVAIAIAFICFIYAFFFAYQNDVERRFYKSQLAISDSINSQAMLNLNNEVIRSLGQKVIDIQYYVDAGQKNLDMWLKLLAFILSLLIGYSIFNGFRMKERAKEELADIRRIKEEIKTSAGFAETRLEVVKRQIEQIEEAAIKAKGIEKELRQKLEDFSNKEDLALTATQKKSLEETIEKAKEELQKSGIDAIKNLYLAKAFQAQNENHFEDLIRLTNTYIDLDDSNYVAFSLRGYAYTKLDVKQGKNDLFYVAFVNRSYAYIELKKYNEAIADADEAIRLNPNSYLSFTNRGYAKVELKKLPEAIADLNEAIRLNPSHYLAFVNKSYAYIELKKYNEAIADATVAIRLNPTYYKSYNNRGYGYFELKKYPEAIADLDEAIRLNPKYIKAHYNRSRAYEKIGKLTEAKQDKDEALRLSAEELKNA